MALWNATLERAGPGLLLQDILAGDDPQITAAVIVIAALDADILILTGFDHDARGQALAALAERLWQSGHPYPHRHAPRTNAGIPTGFDADADGRPVEAADAQGWGRFPGSGSLAVLSRFPLGQASSHADFLWRDLPGTLMPPDTDPGLAAIQRLSSHTHTALPVRLGGQTLTLLLWHATPPAFDGPEDRNGRRNHDEAAFWLHLLNGTLPFPPPAPPFVLMGQANLDPLDGDGRPQALRSLLTHPALQDPAPRGPHSRTEPGHSGDPALDTALYDRLGGLRLSYILPSTDLTVTASGILWPPPDDPLAATLAAASHHRPVWVDLHLPATAATPAPLDPNAPSR